MATGNNHFLKQAIKVSHSSTIYKDLHQKHKYIFYFIITYAYLTAWHVITYCLHSSTLVYRKNVNALECVCVDAPSASSSCLVPILFRESQKPPLRDDEISCFTSPSLRYGLMAFGSSISVKLMFNSAHWIVSAGEISSSTSEV